MQMGRVGDGAGRGQHPILLPGPGQCCCPWPLQCRGLAGREGFGARSKRKGPALLQSHSNCSSVCSKRQGGIQLLHRGAHHCFLNLLWLFTLLLPFPPLHPLFLPHLPFRPGVCAAFLQCDHSCLAPPSEVQVAAAGINAGRDGAGTAQEAPEWQGQDLPHSPCLP